jgi:hypothetical protein
MIKKETAKEIAELVGTLENVNYCIDKGKHNNSRIVLNGYVFDIHSDTLDFLLTDIQARCNARLSELNTLAAQESIGEVQ